MIEALQLEKTYTASPPVHALRGLSFECAEGEVVGILGPNGAGKTTTLRILSTTIAPTSGRATVAGYDIRRDAEQVRQHIGFLSGDTGLYGRLTPREMITYFGSFYGLAGDELSSRVAAVIELLGIRRFVDQRCDSLSTGQRQRVSLARTLVHDPPVLILDEPSAGLDVIAADTIVEFIRRCRNEGRAIVFSTHIMSEAERLCDRIILLHRGESVLEGTPADVKERCGVETIEDAFLTVIGADE